MSVQPYNREKFTSNLHAIRQLTVTKPGVFVPELVKLCAPKTLVSGATRWLGPDRPLIQLTLRHKCNDMFWFSFFHECGHVRNEDAKGEVLLEAKFDGLIDHRQVAANKFAMDIPKNSLPQLGPKVLTTMRTFFLRFDVKFWSQADR